MSDFTLLSRRERHKDERRTRIIDAAHALLREVGADELSVKMIAERADVSAATIYNLLGSKGAVLAKVYDNDFQGFAAKFEAAASKNALDAMFDAIRIAADLYRHDPGFYRGMVVQNPRAEPGLAEAVQAPRQAFWRTLLDQAIHQGDLEPGIRTDLLATAILELGDGAFGYWRADLITIDEFAEQTAYGVARLLVGVAREAGEARLRARIEVMECVPSRPAMKPALA